VAAIATWAFHGQMLSQTLWVHHLMKALVQPAQYLFQAVVLLLQAANVGSCVALVLLHLLLQFGQTVPKDAHL